MAHLNAMPQYSRLITPTFEIFQHYYMYYVVCVVRRGSCGMLPIHMAALNGFIDCLRKLLISTSGFNIDTTDAYGRTCLHAAACGG